MSLPPSMTGKWRSRFSVISAMRSWLVLRGCTYMTGRVMMTRSGVSLDPRAISATLRA